MKKAFLLLICCMLLLCAAASAEVIEGSLGCNVHYNPEWFYAYTDGEIDTLWWAYPVEGTPNCFMSLSKITGYTLDEAMEGLELQAGFQGVHGEMTLGGKSLKTFYYHEGINWNDRICQYACAELADGSVLLVEMNWYADVQESVGWYLQNMLTTLTFSDSASIQFAQCDVCGCFYEEGNIFRNHICIGEPDHHTNASAPARDTQYVKCDRCGNWYEAGNVFRNHVCVTPKPAKQDVEYVKCDRCGNWYEAGNVFRNHICSGEIIPYEPDEPPAEAEMVKCDLCGGWFEAGNVFRNHICSGTEEPYEPDEPPAEAEMVQCDACGEWFEAGNVFRNHNCSEGEGVTVEYVQCDVCGNTYEAGNEFRNHLCMGAE